MKEEIWVVGVVSVGRHAGDGDGLRDDGSHDYRGQMEGTDCVVVDDRRQGDEVVYVKMENENEDVVGRDYVIADGRHDHHDDDQNYSACVEVRAIVDVLHHRKAFEIWTDLPYSATTL